MGLLEGPSLAPGSIFVVKGAWLGPDELVHASGPYPLELAGSQLEIRPLGSGEVYLAPLIHAWTFQVAGVLPDDLPPGQAEVTAIFEGRRSEPAQFRVDESAPALFSVGQTGIGPAVVQNWESSDSTPLNSFTRPARLGQTLVLWGTGLNNTDGSRDIRVLVGDGAGQIELRPFYAGPAPGLPGVDQINLTLPSEGIAAGCLQRLSFSVDNVVSIGSSTMAIAADGGPCSHPWGLSEDELRTLDEGGQIPFASFSLIDTQGIIVNVDGLTSSVVAANVQTLLVAADGLDSLTRDNRVGFANELLSCGPGFTVFARIGNFVGEPLPEPPPPDQLPREFAHAGDTVTLYGPDGQQIDLILDGPPGTSSRWYRTDGALEPNVFTPGSWTLRAPGGEDIGAFEGDLTIPPFPAVAPPDRIRRDEDVQIGWDATPYTDDQAIRVSIAVRYRDEDGQSQVWSAGCRAKATLGGFRIEKGNFADSPEPTDGFAEFTVAVQADEPFQAPALSHGRASYQASRITRVPFE